MAFSIVFAACGGDGQFLARKTRLRLANNVFTIPNEWLTSVKTALSLGFLVPILRRFVGSRAEWRIEASLL
jgi:hypothetical protein